MQAVNSAGAGDEVIVRPGLYLLAATLDDQAPITIHGVAGQPRPVVVFTGLNGMTLKDSTLRYMEIVGGDPAMIAFLGLGSTVDQVIVRGGSAADCAAGIVNGTMRNSIVVARSPDGSAICAGAWSSTNASTLRNVTAVAQDGVAIEAYAGGSTGSTLVNVVNVIAKADQVAAGLWAHTETAGAHATILVTNTNYAKSWTGGSDAIVAAGSGNQGTPPAFVNEATGDYRQRAGSVTIDAGLDDPANGMLDVDGDPRKVGSPDIGADEFVAAPTAATDPAGVATGDDQSFTTAPAAPTTPAGGFAGVKLVSSRLTLKGGFIVVKLSCPAGTSGRCTGVTKLRARRNRTSTRAAATVRLGRAGFSIAAGERAKVKVRVSRAGRRLFTGARRLRGRAANAAHNGAGEAKTTIAAVTIRKGTR